MQVHNDFPLSDILWYKVGGTARYLIEVRRKEDVYRALDFLEKNHVEKVFVCGLGANLVFSDNYYDGAVIRFVTREQKTFSPTVRPTEKDIFTTPPTDTIKRIHDQQIEAFAGELLENTVLSSFQHYLTGFEWAGGLPGTVGAGVRGNVGCFGSEIKDVLYDAEVVDLSGNRTTRRIKNEDLLFSYRHSLIKENRNLIVIAATFQLHQGDEEALEAAKAVYRKNIAYRQKNHPLDYVNCGSVFKNIRIPEQVQSILNVWPDIEETVNTKWYGKVSVAYIIGRFGLAGKRVGDIQISEKHNNFIVNHGKGNAADFKAVIHEVQQNCQVTFGFAPEVEVEVVE